MTKRSKISGINLVGLMISSALGAFILAVIVKVSFTVSNNFQIIKATSELEASARILNSFFGKILPANGYNNNDQATNITAFQVSSDNNIAKFTLRYAGGIDGALLCSRKQADSQAPPFNITISFKKPTTSEAGYANCQESISTDPMPIISNANIKDFYMAAIGSNIATPPNISNLVIKDDNVLTYNSKPPFNAIGIKLAILLKSTNPVFNVDRKVSFDNIFPDKTFANFDNTHPRGDKYLYKLVIIQLPFMYTINPNDNSQNNKITLSTLSN